jgi:uncharacterized protein (DUF1330 family)
LQALDLAGLWYKGFNAQAKPKAFRIVESQVLDPAALAVYAPLNAEALKAVGARTIAPAGEPVSFVGDAPTRIGIVEFESVDSYRAYRNSDTFKKLTPQRDKALKIIRSYVIEAPNSLVAGMPILCG